MTDAQVNAVVDSVVQQLKMLGVTAFFVGARTPDGAFTSAFGKPDEVIFMVESLKLEVIAQNEIIDDDMGLGRLV